jgi:DNA-binding SARP family transcriptional activator/cytochrome c-type biogenesis protein CcmH/NrfG
MSFQLRMLGPMTVSRDGCMLALPASRKVRALVAYLALAPRDASRRQLCEFLWDAPSDPRGELRWCLSKVRAIIGASRVGSRDESVRLELSDCFVDALEIERAAAAGIGKLAPARAKALVALFSGDFLEGLEIDRCPAFTGWLLAQRRRFQAWRIELLARLADSTPDDEALAFLERWLELAPFDVRAHARLLATLARHGRIPEGEEHLAASVRLFTTEGLDSAPLRLAWRSAKARAGGVVCFERKRGDDGRAHECYLQGRQHLGRMMRRGLEAGREMFVRAIELDAGYGPAWAGLATVHACLCEWFGAGADGIARAEEASRRALEVAPRLAEAHVARGLARSLSRRYDDAVGAFEEAIRIDPYLFDAYYYFARTTFACGDMERAAELFRLAAALRGEDFQSPILLGTALRVLGREDAAREAGQTGIRRAEQVLARDPLDGRALSLTSGALFGDGQVERALEWSRRSLELYPDDASALVNGACLQALVGQNDEALDLLERVFARGCGKRDWVLNDPDYDGLRDDPRFERLVVGLK